MEFIDIVLRSVVIYIFIIVGIRLLGKRELSQLSIVDLVFVLLISNAVQNAMIGSNTSIIGGLVAAASLFIANQALGFLMLRSKKAQSFLEGSPIMLIYHGRIITKHLKKAGITDLELEEAIREHGVEKATNVDLAVLETDGNISVLSHNYTHNSSHKRKSSSKKIIDAKQSLNNA